MLVPDMAIMPGPQAPPQMAQPTDPGAAAPGAPAAPPSPMGMRAAAAQKVVESRKMLEGALVIFGSESEEGKALVTAIKALGSIFHGEAGSVPSDNAPQSAPMGGPKPGAQMGF